MGRPERRGKEEHEKALSDYIENSKNKIIDLAGKSPDAIEAILVDGEIILRAVEVLPIRWAKGQQRWQKSFTHTNKEYSYRMFDEVKIITYKLNYSKPSFLMNWAILSIVLCIFLFIVTLLYFTNLNDLFKKKKKKKINKKKILKRSTLCKVE